MPLFEKKPKYDYELFCKAHENAKDVAHKLGYEAVAIKHGIDNIDRFSLLVLGNDWGMIEQKLNCDFLTKGKNTVCIQESSIDFNPIYKKMKHCSFPVFQGVSTLSNIDVRGIICAVIGNPRFENLKPETLPEKDQMSVNVNFTYGIFEEARDSWVEDVVSVSNETGVDYKISQHPRDKGNLENYNVVRSNALLVHDLIKESSILVSRFSALLTEAICLGRFAIYYNPHGENMHYKFEADNKMFYYATNRNELKQAVESILKNKNEETQSNFLALHIGNSIDGKASDYINMLLNDVAGYPVLKKLGLKQRLKLMAGIFKRRYILKQNY
ncbi:hypothetical protein AM493_10245 [Flavobacterium akiainvivens]|uniref:Uncharacterized protein n=1 Tax=Flavobacterium akiainvivens TaxID=1202724 RepID=A0A0M9VI71_9FLAO|nr:hypothetical protein [Flavobacterium akiainvivens]KOS06366.1 hypothetical protein AM493_10245 [Flavobacterium akiainvivens]